MIHALEKRDGACVMHALLENKASYNIKASNKSKNMSIQMLGWYNSNHRKDNVHNKYFRMYRQAAIII